MGDIELLHLAVIGSTVPWDQDDLDRTVRSSCAKAAEIAREAFALIPGLRAFSWIDPALDNLLSRAAAPAAARASADGALALGKAAAELGLALRVCGRTEDLPAAHAARQAPPDARGTLLWFQRYRSRDEIVRAAGRFFAAHPGAQLADGDLDAWLDTAGLPDPDLLIHVGGALEPRDALLWQGSYAEISHEPGPLSAFAAVGLRRAVADFRDRQRRFGR
jgi:hypothetical protein